MTAPDPFEFDDAAYLLGALSEPDRVAFEAHLLTCTACTARVREIDSVTSLLSDVTVDEARSAVEPLPDTLLPALLHRAAAQQRRQRRLVGVLAGVAAACLVALAVVFWPTGSSAPVHDTARGHAFVAVAQSPVRATATLTAKRWGTEIDVHCHYVPGSVDRSFNYDLVVYDRRGVKQTVGSWSLPPDRDIEFPSGTALPPDQIARIEIALPNGTPVLRLTTD